MQIAAETNGNYYAIIADESRDTGHKEQMSLVLRYVVQEDGIHGKNVIKESFLGFAACGSLSAAGLCETLLTSLRDCRIDLLGCVAQCFDGAAVMSELCPKAIYVHCFAHRLNLVIVDVVHDTARATTSSHCCSRCTTSSPRRLSTNCTSRLRGPAFLILNLARYHLFQIRVGYVAMMPVRLSRPLFQQLSMF